MDSSSQVTAQKRGAPSRRVWLAAAVVIGILGLAWFDGGEEALHPISQEVSIPEVAE